MNRVVITPEANAFCDQAEEMMCYLAARWQDEKDHEHIDSYMQPLAPIAEKCGVQLTAMQKRPFGVKYTVAGKTYLCYVSGRTYGYKRIA